MNKKIWFKAKKFGLGWRPITWQGWIITAAYVIAIVSVFRKVDAGSHSNSDTLIGFALPFILITAIFLLICYRTGDRSN